MDYQPVPTDSDAAWQTEVETCEQTISGILAEENELEGRFTYLRDFWGRRRTYMVTELDKLRDELERAEADLELRLHPKFEFQPPGPKLLLWLDTNAFNWTCSAVILANIVAIVLESGHPSLMETFWLLDQLFLIFYTVEMILKLMLYHWHFIVGPLRTVWWNWLDLAIVFGGITEQWLAPAFISSHGQESPFAPIALRVIRVLRVMRVIRCVKLVNTFLRTDLTWTESAGFHTFITCIIVLNAVIMAFELDYGWSGWYWTEQFMLAIYFFELSVRLKRWGWHFFVDPAEWAWNNLDFVIVGSGLAEQVVPVVTVVHNLFLRKGHLKIPTGSLLPLIRMLRLLRVFRLLRLIKTWRPLYKLTIGVLAAAQAVQWVILFTAIMLYACAIVARSILGTNDVVTLHDTSIQAIFCSVPESVFYLFRLMNGLTPTENLMSTALLRWMYIVFLILSNWGVLAILTGVVSDSMVMVQRGEQWAQSRLTSHIIQANLIDRMSGVFRELDKDGDGALTECEFYSVMRNKELCDDMCTAYNLKETDLRNLFLFLSHEDEHGQPIIDFHDFIEKLSWEGKNISERSAFRVEKQLILLEQRIGGQLDTVRDDVTRITRKTELPCVYKKEQVICQRSLSF